MPDSGINALSGLNSFARWLQLRKCPTRGVNGMINVVHAVCDRHKTRFKRRWRQIHAFLQHQVEETLKAFNVARHHVLIAGYALGVGEENPEHAADMVDDQWDLRLLRCFA
nr:Uncharacterised protein [Salmonella sp. NCTC 7297]